MKIVKINYYRLIRTLVFLSFILLLAYNSSVIAQAEGTVLYGPQNIEFHEMDGAGYSSLKDNYVLIGAKSGTEVSGTLRQTFSQGSLEFIGPIIRKK